MIPSSRESEWNRKSSDKHARNTKSSTKPRRLRNMAASCKVHARSFHGLVSTCEFELKNSVPQTIAAGLNSLAPCADLEGMLTPCRPASQGKTARNSENRETSRALHLIHVPDLHQRGDAVLLFNTVFVNPIGRECLRIWIRTRHLRPCGRAHYGSVSGV